MIKNIPNFITCINLLFGCLGLVLLFSGDPMGTAICIWAAAVCDFFDGFAARAVKAESAMGKELDSLADGVSFGVVPALLWFYYMVQSIQPGTYFVEVALQMKWPFLAFLMAMCSAWRLAKFNIDTRQTDHFRGVPTPANALVWSAVPFISSESLFPWAQVWVSNPAFMIVFGVVMSVLLVVDVPLIALKFKDWSWKSNKIKYSFLIIALGLLICLEANGIFFVFFSYLGASLLENKSKGL
ncbi:MAG: pssA [Chitinophagaceae bacterium]|nr:pssA [Chitinophagaceae bacterium]